MDFKIKVRPGNYTDEGVQPIEEVQDLKNDFARLLETAGVQSDLWQDHSSILATGNASQNYKTISRGDMSQPSEQYALENLQQNMKDSSGNLLSGNIYGGQNQTVENLAGVIALQEETNARQNAENESLRQENQNLHQQNQALITKLQSRLATGVFQITEQNGVLYLFNHFCSYFLSSALIGFVVWVRVQEKDASIKRVLAVEVKGTVRVFKEQELAGEKILSKLRIQSEERLEIEKVSDKKIASALKTYLIKKAKENEEITIPATAGWDSETEKFVRMEHDEIFREIMEQMFPAHPLLKREFASAVQKKVTHPFEDGKMQNTLWELALFGSVLRSVFVKNGVLQWFGVWIQNDKKGNEFVRNFLKIWHTYFPQAYVENSKEVKTALVDCKDEPVLFILEKSSRAESNREKLTKCLSSGQEFANGIPVLALPVFMGDDYGLFQNDEELVVFPFFLHDDFQDGQVQLACQMIPAYIWWCEENQALLELIIEGICYGDRYQSEDFSILPVLFAIKAIVFAYCKFCQGKTVSKLDIFEFMQEKGVKECRALLEWIKAFNEEPALEKVRGMFVSEYNEGKLQIRSRKTMSETQIQSSLIFDSDGSFYIDKDFFEQIVGRHFSKSICHSIIKNLVTEGVIFTEKNGVGRVRADLRRTVPKGSGNERRFYRFKAGTLLNAAGCLIGTQTRQNISEYISLGKDDVGFDVFWDLKNAMNRHLTITGISGSGKSSYAFSLARNFCEKGIPCIFFDYSGSCRQEWQDEELVEFIDVQDFPVNPLYLRQYTDGQKESVAECAKRVSAMLGKVLKLSLAEEKVIYESLSSLYTKKSEANLAESEKGVRLSLPDGKIVYEAVMSFRIKKPELSFANLLKEIMSRGVAEKSPLHRLKQWNIPKGKRGKQWGDFLGDSPKLVVITMENMPMKEAVDLTEWFLLDLISWYRASRAERPEIMIWLDEIQNLSADEGMPVDTLFREMRKYGIGIMAISQAFHTMTNSMQLALQQAALKIYFRQDAKGARKFASDQADTEAERKRLSREAKMLSVGEFFAVGGLMDVNGDVCNSQCWHVYPD